MLKENTVYNYTYRYRYVDGHYSRTCEPMIIKTTAQDRNVGFNIILAEDLNSDVNDKKYAEVEVYRKKPSTEYQLIEYIDPNDGDYTIKSTSVFFLTFKDDGKLGRGILDDYISVSSKSHKTHTEVQDRVVKGNISYADHTNVDLPFDFGIRSEQSTHEDGDFSIPSGSNVQLFGKVVYKDNQDSFHFPVSNKVDGVPSGSDIVFYTPSIAGLDKYKDLSLYLKLEKNDEANVEDNAIPFNTIEVNNVNVPTLATWNEDPSFNNQSPHIFLGWKYIVRHIRHNKVDDEFVLTDLIRDGDFDQQPSEQGSENAAYPLYDAFSINYNSYPESEVDFDILTPDHVDFEIVDGVTLPYNKHVVSELQSIPFVGVEKYFVYKLSFADSLKLAIRQGEVKIKMSQSFVSRVSTKKDLSEYIDFEEDVVDILDTSFGSNDFYNNQYERFTTPQNSRMYLVLDNDSIYNDIDRYSVVNDNVLGEYDEDGDFHEGLKNDGVTPTLSFDILGVDYERGYGSTPESLPHYDLYEGLEGSLTLTSSKNLDSVTDQLVYVGSFDSVGSFNNNIVDGNTLKYTGFEFVEDNNLKYTKLTDNVILESPILKLDLNITKQEYPHQLIWSQPTQEGSTNNNSRTYLYSSFLNVGSKHGQILRVESLGNDLLVFCERGVAKIRVGEKLANQSSGDIYIDSSTFLSSPVWLLENLPYVQRNSIVSAENSIFFADGRDCWLYRGKMNKISSGNVDLNGYCVGAYDTKNAEYRVSVFPDSITGKRSLENLPCGEYTDTPKTFSYSTELGQWSGPHTYGDIQSTFRNGRLVSVVDESLGEHNIENNFLGRGYQTVIESTANDLNDLTVVKRYRKFYLDIATGGFVENDLIFEYGTDYLKNYKVVDLYYEDTINGLYKVGFVSAEGRPNNSRKVFWKIGTTLEDFTLNSLSFSYLPTKR